MNVNNCWERVYEHIKEGRIDKAIEICESKFCADNSIQCLRFLGWTLYEQNETEEALRWFDKGIAMNDVESIYGAACVYLSTGEFEPAVVNYQKSLELGYKRSAYWLGYMFEKGFGVNENVDKAMEYYKLSDQNGYLIGERAYINLIFHSGKIHQKFSAIPKLVYIVIKSFFLAKKNIKDERLAEIPNVLDRRDGFD